ncbi:hypothetical protein ACFFX0_27355 [Citricoccus parietis]|uniref:Uncharacterized protein n=1 Tax=Citricoccus parietis TaxID=592307 RepID=A0ABV5G733_9MICC
MASNRWRPAAAPERLHAPTRGSSDLHRHPRVAPRPDAARPTGRGLRYPGRPSPAPRAPRPWWPASPPRGRVRPPRPRYSPCTPRSMAVDRPAKAGH